MKPSVSCQCSHMSNHQRMMSYAQGSGVGTTSTSVPECRKETPDRLAVCTVERTVTHSLLLRGEPPAQQDHNHHRVHGGRSRIPWTGPPEPPGPQGGRGESPTQHSCHRGDRPQQPRFIGGRRGTHTMGGGVGGGVATLDHIPYGSPPT